MDPGAVTVRDPENTGFMMKMRFVMKMKEAIEKRIPRLRQETWGKNAYLRIDLLDGGYVGPWAHLFDREIQEVCELPTPQTILRMQGNPEADFEEYTGPIDPADTRK
jgi:hypothetical protein